MPVDLRPRVAALTALAAVLVAVGVAAPAVAGQRSVTMVDNRFQPATISITAGDAVVWVNRGEAAHTVTSRVNGQFDSLLVQSGKGFVHTFARAGTYRYYCFLHDGMNGTVIVKPVAVTPRPTVRPHPTTRPRPTTHHGGGGTTAGRTQPPTDTAAAAREDPAPFPTGSALLVLLGAGALGAVVFGTRRLRGITSATLR
jgi:plastocyanin